MGSRSPMGRGNFEEDGAAHCKVWGTLSMCGGEAAVCQITLTICLSFFPSTDFSTSLNRFSRNFVTRSGSAAVCPIVDFICAS